MIPAPVVQCLRFNVNFNRGQLAGEGLLEALPESLATTARTSSQGIFES